MADLLIVEDDADAANALSALLEFEGHVVRTAYNGEEGLQRLEERVPELVLLDIEMPILDGPNMAYRMLLHNLDFEKVPIVLVSGVPNLRSIAAHVGTHYFLPKPFTLERLTSVLERALE